VRSEFHEETKKRRLKHAAGRCEACGCWPARVEFHHQIRCELGGGNDFDNCRVLCIPCHKERTGEDISAIAKSNRLRKRHASIRKDRTITRWRKFNGEIVYADRKR
jgi:5-methylcytosine-specific restriction enzyme A